MVGIHCDNEFYRAMDNFAAVLDPIINMNCANSKEHVPRSKWNNRTIRERIRVSYYQSLYMYLSRILVKYMVCEVTRKLNYFTAKYGVSKYYSHRMIIHK